MDKLLEVRDLSAGYQRPVVQNISFSIRKGELAAVLGRNGCGKTTLLRGLTGGAKGMAVSYTHLDVYKRQRRHRPGASGRSGGNAVRHGPQRRRGDRTGDAGPHTGTERCEGLWGHCGADRGDVYKRQSWSTPATI